MNEDVLFQKFSKPPCSGLLGMEFIDYSAERRCAKFSFEGRQEFLNPAGFVQGGILTSMLDDTMGPTVLLVSGSTLYTSTISITVNFFSTGHAREASFGRIGGQLRQDDCVRGGQPQSRRRYDNCPRERQCSLDTGG
jgi:acyl-coenzyme A thioesterase PaaI-like protein